MLGQLPLYSQLTPVDTGYYNSMSTANKAIIDIALSRPVLYYMLDGSKNFERRTWATSGEIYTGYCLRNNKSIIVYVFPDIVTSYTQGCDCVYDRDDKYCGVGIIRDNQFNTEHREGYYYRVNYDTATFVSASSFLPLYNSLEDILLDADSMFPASPTSYPITYYYTNSTINGPSEAAIGDTVTVTAVPDVDYGITDASTQILVTNNDIAIPYTWDATNNRITFTMPDPT